MTMPNESVVLAIWKAETEDAPKVTSAITRQRRPAQGAFDRMIGKRRTELRKIIERLKSGDIDTDELYDLFDAVLMEGHTHAWILGRQKAGDLRGEELEDVLEGIRHKDPEAQWLQQFVADLADGDARYVDEETGEYKAAAIFNRANLYIGKMRGTANEAFVQASPDEDKKGNEITFEWILGLNEKHCDDCPRIAHLSPFTKDTLFAYPCSGDTACLGNCKCYLRRSDNVRSFLAA